MNSREQTLAIILIGAIVATVAVAGGYYFVLRPLAKQREAEVALTKEVEDLDKQLRDQNAAVARLKTIRASSLPADETLARREYVVALERMIEASGVPKGYTITIKPVDQSSRAVPEITKNKPIYTRVAYEVIFKKVDMVALKEFLQRYYQFGLLHQITSFNIKKDEDPGAKNAGRRDDLTVTFTTEAIIVEGAENRKTLYPVPTAFAAVGGGGLYLGMATNPDAARGVTLPQQAPTLSPLHRDYNLLVLKDPFNGPLPEPPVVPFKLAKISDVKVKTDEKHDPVKVAVSGDGSIGAKVTAIVSGSLFAEGALKVEPNKADPKTFAIELPKTSATEGAATINVIATSADGVATEKASFKVSLAEPPEPPPPKEDISAVIILTGATPRSDGTAWARVYDNANRLRYTIEAESTGVKIVKEWRPSGTLPWRDTHDHHHPGGVLVISDDNTGTNRTFKVLAVDIDGLIVVDLKPDGPPAEKPKPGKGWPGPGGGKAPPKQGHGNPLAVLGGNMIVAVPQPKYYRWLVGQSLKALQPLSDDEVKKVQKAVELSGPVSDVATVRP